MMAATRRSRPGKASGARAAQAPAVVAIAIDVLNNPAVRDFLQKAPAQVASWAKERRSDLQALAAQRSKLTDKFGQKGLENRLAAVRATFDIAFGGPEAPGRAEVAHALDALDAALQVAGPSPLLKRKRAHFVIDNQLDRLERQLIDAVLDRL